MPCIYCGSNSFESNEAAGNTYCRDCGAVAEEDAIVSEITFGQTDQGAARCNGTTISADKARGTIRSGLSGYLQSESRETTIANARKTAQELASALRLQEHFVESAVRYFKLALQKNCTRGRRTEVTLSACLYITCRYEKTSHMLIDFSDVIQTSVFILGSTFLKLVQALHLQNLPLVDPSLYISRFASLLGFGDKTRYVAETASRLATRMNRDWMVQGRRPAGICGACLLLAARIHHFNRSLEDIMMVVKMSSGTIRKRLVEFAETPSGQLTVGEFLNVMLEDACDPPAFKRARMKEANELAQYSHSLGKLDKSEEQSKKPAITEENKLDKELEEEVKQYIAIHEEQKIQTPEEKEVSEDLSILDDDDEFKGIFLDENEVKIKTEFWMDKNADYLDAQEAKLRREKQGLDSGSKKRPRRKNTPKQKVSAGTPAEAAIQLLEQQKLSRKINYDAVRSLFDFDESLG